MSFFQTPVTGDDAATIDAIDKGTYQVRITHAEKQRKEAKNNNGIAKTTVGFRLNILGPKFQNRVIFESIITDYDNGDAEKGALMGKMARGKIGSILKASKSKPVASEDELVSLLENLELDVVIGQKKVGVGEYGADDNGIRNTVLGWKPKSGGPPAGFAQQSSNGPPAQAPQQQASTAPWLAQK